jgi:glycosyltransferase involved in cell wall biosynthesis
VLSFILPAYNCAPFVAETVASIYAQDLDQELEVLCVEDGSTDDTWEILLGLAKEHGDSFRLHRHPRNRGEGATRNTAVRNSRGDLLYVIDADNVLPAGVVQRQVDTLRERGAHAVSVAELHLFEDDHTLKVDVMPVLATDGVSGMTELLTTWRTPASHGNYLMTREVFDAVGGYQEGLTMSAWTFGMKQVARGYVFHIAAGTAYLHRIGHEGNWARGERLGINDRIVMQAMRDELERLPPDLADKVRQLHEDDPFFVYLEEGRLLPGGRLPPRPRRALHRLRRRLRLRDRVLRTR